MQAHRRGTVAVQSGERPARVDRQQHGFAFDEEDFMAHIRAKYPGASFQQPRCNDFQKYVGHFANLGAAAERCRSRSPKHT